MKKSPLWVLSLCAATNAPAQDRMLSEIAVSGKLSDIEERRTAVTQKRSLIVKGSKIPAV